MCGRTLGTLYSGTLFIFARTHSTRAIMCGSTRGERPIMANHLKIVIIRPNNPKPTITVKRSSYHSKLKPLDHDFMALVIPCPPDRHPSVRGVLAESVTADVRMVHGTPDIRVSHSVSPDS